MYVNDLKFIVLLVIGEIIDELSVGYFRFVVCFLYGMVLRFLYGKYLEW